MEEALGLIETLGLVSGIEAADAAVKAGNVKINQWTKIGAGRVCVVLRGDVAAVKASLDAGVAAASQIGKVLSQSIIPRPSEKMNGILPIQSQENNKKK